jgi:galactose oxidase-like protein
MKRSLAAYAITMFVLLGFFAGAFVAGAAAQANVQGKWTTLSSTMPINPIHVALLYTGKILVVSGSGNVAGSTNFRAGVWDPQTNTITTQPLAWDMFCNGMVILPDGRPFINGGTLQYDPFYGELKSSIYDPLTNSFTDVQNMAHGRWYPTVTTLGDGRVMTFSGLLETGGTNTAVEIYTVGSGWSQQYMASWTPPLYPRMHLLPNGNVFYSGPSVQSRIFDPSNKTWTNVAVTNYSATRTYGSSVLLPLTPENNYDPKVMILGGGTTATQSTELIDLGASSPAWQWGSDMSQARIEMNAVILPNGKVLALGGSAKDEDGTTASLNADLYDPAVNAFSSAGANAFPRLYHSVALLLPDATVWLAGGNPQRGTYEQHVEIYQPAYLFTTDLNGNPVLAPRPTISSAPSSVSWGNSFTVQTPDAANISSVVLVRNGAVTHAFDMDQRLVGLSYSTGAGALTVTAPPNGNIAPPGYYMLFLLNSSGVPSMATMIQIGQQPDFSVAATPLSQTVVQGNGTSYNVTITPSGGFSGTVSFSVSGLPQGASASFIPTSVNTSGSTTLSISASGSTPTGSYSLVVTGSSGTLSHSATVTLNVNAPSDFSISASPSSQTITAGSRTSYTITINPIGGFAGTVSLSVTGLPRRANGNFNPSSITGSGTSTLTVFPNKNAPRGTSTLTITGSSGGLSHSTAVSLTIQ